MKTMSGKVLVEQITSLYLLFFSGVATAEGTGFWTWILDSKTTGPSSGVVASMLLVCAVLDSPSIAEVCAT